MYRKWITVYENQMCSVMCSVIHFTVIVFINNAFHLRLINVSLTVCIMHSFCCSDSQTIIWFVLWDNILNMLILCHFKQIIKSVTVDLIKVMSIITLSYKMIRLIRTPASISLFILTVFNRKWEQSWQISSESLLLSLWFTEQDWLTVLTDCDVSKSQQNQILS